MYSTEKILDELNFGRIMIDTIKGNITIEISDDLENIYYKREFNLTGNDLKFDSEALLKNRDLCRSV